MIIQVQHFVAMRNPLTTFWNAYQLLAYGSDKCYYHYHTMSNNTHYITLIQSISKYKLVISESRSQNTARSYSQAMSKFVTLLNDRNINTETTPITTCNESWIIDFIGQLRNYSPATEQLYLTAVAGYYEFLASEYELSLNLARVRALIRRRQRRVPQRLPQFPRENIEKVIQAVIQAATLPQDHERSRLRIMRDEAFILTLSDTGLRISEACSLTRGQYDRNERQAVVIIKGGREAIVRFSRRSHTSITTYLDSRASVDGASGRALSSLPLFARHDLGSGNKTLPIKTVGARNIINKWVKYALGPTSVGSITPHSFRHYFVTIVLRGSGGNLKLAQELARHKSIAITQRYAHLSDDDLDRGYHNIFDE